MGSRPAEFIALRAAMSVMKASRPCRSTDAKRILNSSSVATRRALIGWAGNTRVSSGRTKTRRIRVSNSLPGCLAVMGGTAVQIEDIAAKEAVAPKVAQAAGRASGRADHTDRLCAERKRRPVRDAAQARRRHAGRVDLIARKQAGAGAAAQFFACIGIGHMGMGAKDVFQLDATLFGQGENQFGLPTRRIDDHRSPVDQVCQQIADQSRLQPLDRPELQRINLGMHRNGLPAPGPATTVHGICPAWRNCGIGMNRRVQARLRTKTFGGLTMPWM